MRQAIVVLDIGKTNVKVSALALDSSECLMVKRIPNTPLTGGIYPRADIEGIWSWFKAQLVNISSCTDIRYITCTTHGATAVCLENEQLALPVLDYEFEGCEQSNSMYECIRPGYAETASPSLSAGLNLGRQLYWQSVAYSKQFTSCTDILMYPQYWCWRLSGVKCSEVTSLGCHTDLWAPEQKTYSSMVRQLGWQSLFPQLIPAGAVLGPILSELAAELGLSNDCQIINGIHDSNASLVPYLLSVEEPFSVVSTGTWVIAASVGSRPEEMAESKDMLYNVNAFGDPVACMRFMGGREWEILRGQESCDLKDLVSVLNLEVQVVPSYSNQGGAFRHHAGTIKGPINQLNSPQHTALASVYCALMTDYCLDQLCSAGNIYIEGSFTKNPVYLSALQVFRSVQPLYKSIDSTGTTLGTAILLPQIRSMFDLQVESELPLDEPQAELLLEYRAKWRDLVSAI